MFRRYRNTPERLAFRDVEGQAKAAQISEARASQAAARHAMLDAMPHLSPEEILDLVTAHMSGRMDPETLRKALAEAERAADRLCSEAHLASNGPALARIAWVQE